MLFLSNELRFPSKGGGSGGFRPSDLVLGAYSLMKAAFHGIRPKCFGPLRCASTPALRNLEVEKHELRTDRKRARD